ncbi:MAG: nuclear transport factor 2 family protein [Ginsengibacter sp.]
MKSDSNYIKQNAQHKEQPANGNEQKTLSDISKNIVERHLNSFVDNDLDGVMADYTNESVMITQDATYTGIKEIRAFFIELNVHFPKQKSSFELGKLVAKDDLVYIVWNAKTPSLHVPIGSDTFIIKDGKISQQTFVGQLNFTS